MEKRRFLSGVILAALAVLAAVAPLAASGAPGAARETLADRVPEDVLLYAAFEDPAAFRAGARGTALGKIWREEEIQSARSEFRRFVEKEADDELLPFLKAAKFALIAPLTRCELAVWIDTAPDGKTCLRGMAAVESGDGKSPRGALETGITSLMRGEHTAERRADGMHWRGRGGDLLLVERGATCFLTGVAAERIGDLAAEDLSRATPQKPLARLPLFASALETLGKRDPGRLVAFANLEVLKRWLVRAPEVARELDIEPELVTLVRALGFDRLQTAGLSLAPEGEGFRSRFHLLSSWETGTLPAALASAGRSPLRSFDRLPADVLVASAARVPWEALWKAGARVLDRLPAEDVAEVRGGLEAVQKGSSVRILADLLPVLGEETAFCLGKPAPGLIPIPPMTAMVEVKDAKKAEACLARIADYAAAQGAPYAKTPYGGRTLYHFGGAAGGGMQRMDPMGGLFQPTFVVTETHLVAATSPQALKSLLSAWKRPEFAGVAGTERFKAARGKVPADAPSAAYVDLPEVVTFVYNTVLQFAGVAQGFGGEDLPFNMNALPSADVLTRHLAGSVESVDFRADGIRISSWSPIGINLSGLDPVTVSALAGFFWIQEMEDRRRSSIWTCQYRLQQLGQQISQHEARHGAPPRRLADLYADVADESWWEISNLYCPLDPNDPGSRQGGVDRWKKWPETHPPSFRHVRARPGKAEPATRVQVYEAKACHGGRRHVLFANGSVELVDETRFKELADAQGFLAPPAPPPAATPELLRQIDEKVKALSANDFSVREEATEWLMAAGPAAVPAVKRAVDTTDPEVKSRARQILDQIDIPAGE